MRKYLLSLICIVTLTQCTTIPNDENQEILATAERARLQGDLTLAITSYKQAIKNNQGGSAAYQGLGEMLLLSDSNQEALRVFQEGITYDGKHAGLYRGLGWSYLNLHNAEKALPNFQKALELDPRDVKGLNGLGVTYDALNQYKKAQSFYRAGLELNPHDQALTTNLALSLAFSGFYSEAVKLLEPLAKSPQSTPQIRQNMFLVYALAGKKAQARRIGRKDLDERSVKNNLSYIAAVKEVLKDNQNELPEQPKGKRP